MKKIFTLIISIILITSLSSCSKESDLSDYEQIKESGELVVGFTDFPPFGYMDNGVEKGLDLEIAKLVCLDLGLDFKAQYIDWDTKIMEINSKKVDVIWNGMTLTDEVAKNLTVSKTYFKTELVVITNKGKEFASVDDLVGKKIAVEANSSSDISLSGNDDYNVIDFTTTSECLLALKGNQVDAFVVDSTYANDYIMKKENAKDSYAVSSFTVGEKEDYVIGFRKGSTSLRDAVDASIDSLYERGDLDNIITEYFGSIEGSGFTR